MSKKPILCLDFDGVIHSYESGWKGADKIPDDPVPGAITFLMKAAEHFEVHIFSSRSNQDGGIPAMMEWLRKHATNLYGVNQATNLIAVIGFPTAKPPAMLTIDDRAITFDGTFPEPTSLLSFKPWNKK